MSGAAARDPVLWRGSRPIRDTPPIQHEPSPFDVHLDHIRSAPADDAPLELIVRRPAKLAREIVDEAQLDVDGGLVGDRWADRDEKTPVYMQAQLTVMSTRVLAAIEPDPTRWPLAGDQLYLDLDLSEANLPAGTRLAVGTALIEVTETPHTGCDQFRERFGGEALRWINSLVGRSLRMRGLNARVVRSGTIRVGDRVTKA